MKAVYTLLGLPVEGAMGTQPILSTSAVLAAASFLFSILAQAFGWSLPVELQGYADEWGTPIAGAFAALVTLIWALYQRRKVVSPATADGMVSQVAANPASVHELREYTVS